MDKIIKYILLNIILIFCFTLISACQEDNGDGGIPIEESHQKPPEKLKPAPSGKSTTISRSSHDTVYTSIPDPNSQIKITKLLSPDLGTTYLVGDELVVIVEVQNLNNKDIYGLSICERIDNNLEIINGSITNCYITRFANISSTIINSLRNNRKIINIRNLTPIFNQKDGFIEIYIDRLPIKGRAIYCYKLKPINEGIFSAATIISFKEKDYSDYEYYLVDECKKLNTIKVVVTPEKTKLYTGNLASLGGGSSAKINYQITYLHQLSQNSGKKLKGKFYESNEYYIIDYVYSNGSRFEDPSPNDNEKPFEIDYGHNCIITIGITYLKENVANAPIMFLDEMPQEANSQIIIIESFFWSRIEFFAALFSAIILIGIELLILRHQNNIMKMQSSELKDISTAIVPEFSKMNDNINLISKELHIVVTEREEASALTSRELRLLHDDLNQIYNKIKK